MKKKIESINKSQEEIKNTISELKNTVEGIKSTLDETEDKSSKLEDKVEKKPPERTRKGKQAQKEWRGNKGNAGQHERNNIHIIGIPEDEEEDQGIEKLFEKVMMENFPNLMREKVTQVQETQSPKQEEPKETHCKTHHN